MDKWNILKQMEREKHKTNISYGPSINLSNIVNLYSVYRVDGREYTWMQAKRMENDLEVLAIIPKQTD